MFICDGVDRAFRFADPRNDNSTPKSYRLDHLVMFFGGDAARMRCHSRNLRSLIAHSWIVWIVSAGPDVCESSTRLLLITVVLALLGSRTAVVG